MLNVDQVKAAYHCNAARYIATGEKIWFDRAVGLYETMRQLGGVL